MPTHAEHATNPDLTLGSRVHVRWGLDLLPGSVSDRYDAGSGSRVVVTLDSPGPNEDEPLTVTVPESEVYTEEDATSVGPPGSWVPRTAYMRQLHDALGRLLPRLAPATALKDVGVEGREYDYVIETSDGRLLIVVKYVHEGEFTGRRAALTLAQMERSPRSAKVLISNAEIPSAARRRLAMSHVAATTWRSEADDAELERAITDALVGG